MLSLKNKEHVPHPSGSAVIHGASLLALPPLFVASASCNRAERTAYAQQSGEGGWNFCSGQGCSTVVMKLWWQTVLFAGAFSMFVL